MDERRKIFRVYIELCKHDSQPISDQNSQMLYYKTVYLYGKNVLYFFYNITQKNTKLLQ